MELIEILYSKIKEFYLSHNKNYSVLLYLYIN